MEARTPKGEHIVLLPTQFVRAIEQWSTLYHDLMDWRGEYPSSFDRDNKPWRVTLMSIVMVILLFHTIVMNEGIARIIIGIATAVVIGLVLRFYRSWLDGVAAERLSSSLRQSGDPTLADQLDGNASYRQVQVETENYLLIWPPGDQNVILIETLHGGNGQTVRELRRVGRLKAGVAELTRDSQFHIFPEIIKIEGESEYRVEGRFSLQWTNEADRTSDERLVALMSKPWMWNQNGEFLGIYEACAALVAEELRSFLDEMIANAWDDKNRFDHLGSSLKRIHDQVWQSGVLDIQFHDVEVVMRRDKAPQVADALTAA